MLVEIDAPGSASISGENTDIPFGGYKQSGNGRENGQWGLEGFLELKAIIEAVSS